LDIDLKTFCSEWRRGIERAFQLIEHNHLDAVDGGSAKPEAQVKAGSASSRDTETYETGAFSITLQLEECQQNCKTGKKP
jgi:hypothetical protein